MHLKPTSSSTNDNCGDSVADVKTSKSKENILLPQKSSKNDNHSVIVTTARPATVISNSSSQSNESFLSKEER